MPSGPKKRRAARNKNRGKQNNGTDPEVEENAFIEPTSIEVEDGLAVKNAAARVEFATPVDVVSSKKVVLNQYVGSKDVFEVGSKEKDGKDVIHVLDSSPEEGKGKELPMEVLDSSLEEGKGKELPLEVLDSGPKENDDKPVELEDRLVVKNAASYVELAEPVDALSPRGIILVQDVGSKDGFELGSKENDGKDVIEHVLDLSLEEEGKGKEPPVEVFDSGPTVNDEVKESALVKQTSIEVEDELIVKNDAANYVELAEPVEALSPRGIVFVRDVGSEDVIEPDLKENDGKEVIKEVLDSSLEEDDGKEPPAEVLDSGPILNAEENALNKPNSVEVEDGLTVKTTAADVELSESIDALFSIEVVQSIGSEDLFDLDSKEVDVKEVIKDVVDSSLDDVFVQDVGSEGLSEQGSKENAGKEVIEHVLDSSLEEGEGKEPPAEVLYSGPKENDHKPVEENTLIEPTSIEVEDELAEPVDVLSPRGIVFDHDVGSEDVFELGSKDNYGKEVFKEVLNSSLEEGDGKEPPAEVLDSGPILKVEENALIEPTSIEVEDGLAVKTAAADVKLAEPVDAVSSKEVILVQNVGSKDVFDMGSKEIDVKEVTEDLLDSSLEEDERKEPPAKVLDSSPMESDEKQIEQSTFIEPSSVEVEDGLVVKTIAADVELSEPIDVLFSKEVVLAQNVGSKDVSELGTKEIDVKEVTEDVLDSSLEEDELKETPADVLHSGPKENDEKPVEESALIESTPIEVEDGLVVETVTADVELAEQVDALSSKGILLVQDVGFEDAFELGSNVRDGTDVFEDVLDSIPGKDEGSKPPAEVNESDPKENDDKQVEENVLTKPTSIELEEGLAVKTAAADVELAEPVDAILTKEIVLVQDVGSGDIFELGSRENDGEEVIKDVLDLSLEKDEGKEPPAEVNGSGPKEIDEKPVEEDDLTKHTSIEVEDGLAVETDASDVELAEPVDAFSPKGVLLVKDVGFEDVFELASKEEVIEDFLDSSLEDDDENESPSEVLDSGPILKVEENALIDPTSIKGEDGLVVKTASTDVELAEPVDTLSSRGIVLVQDVGSEVVSELGSKENYGREVIKHVLDSSLEEDEQEPHAENLDSGPKENDDRPVEESAFIEPTSFEAEDGLAVKIAAEDVELAEPVDDISSRGVVLIQDVGSEDASELGSKENDGREVIEDVLDSSLAEDEQKEPHVEILDSSPKGNDDKPVGDSALTELTSVGMEDGLAVEIGADDVELAEPLDDISSRGVVLVQDLGSEDVLELGSKGTDEKDVTEDVLDSSPEKDKGKEPHAEVDDTRPKENDNKPVEEDALIKTSSIELEDGLALTTAADVELAEPVDTLSKRSVLLQVGEFEDVFELGLKENDEKEVEDVLDSSLEKDEGKEPPCEVNDSCLKENVDNPVEENAIVEPNSIELDDGLALTTDAADVELAEPVDALSSKGVVLDQDICFEDVFQLGIVENDDNPVEENALIAPNSIELEDGFALTTAATDVELAKPVDALPFISYKGVSFVQDIGFEGVFELGLVENDDNPVEENALNEPNPIQLEDGFSLTTAAAEVELAEPVDAVSSKEVILVQDIGSEDVFQLGLEENDGKEVIKDVLDLSLKKVVGKEPPGEFNDSGPKENDEKTVVEDSLIDPTTVELELEDGLGVTTASDIELAKQLDALSSTGVVLDRDVGFEDIFELGSKGNHGKEVIEDFLDSSAEEDDGEEPPVEVLGPDPILKVEKDAHSDPTSIVLESEVGLAAITAGDVELAEPVDALSSKGVVLDRDGGFEDVFELGSKENDGNEVTEDLLDSSSEEDDGEEPLEEVLGSGPILKVLFSKYFFTLLCIVVLLVVWRQQFVLLLSTCSTGSSWSPLLSPIGTQLHEYHSMETDEALVVEKADDIVAEFSDPPDTRPSKGAVLEFCPKKDNGKDLFEGEELAEEVLDSDPMENEGNKPALEVLDLIPRENDGKPAVEDPLTDEFELAFDYMETEGEDLASVVGVDPLDSPYVVESAGSTEGYSVLSREVVNFLELGPSKNDGKDFLEGKEVADEVLDSSPMKNEGKEQAEEVIDLSPNEIENKPVVEDLLTDELELTSKETERKELASVVGGDTLYSPSLVESHSTEDYSILSKEVIHNVLELGSKKDDGKDLLEGRELAEGVLELGQKENVDQPKVKDPLDNELELTSDSKETEAKELASVLCRDPLDSPSVVVSIASAEDDSVLSREVVQNVLELGSKKNNKLLEGKETAEEVLNSRWKENDDKPVVEDPLTDSTEDDSILSKVVVQNAFIEELAEEVLDSVLNENDDKSVVEDPLTDELELESDSKEMERKELAFVVGGDPLDSPSVVDSAVSMEDDSVVSKELNQKDLVEDKVAKRSLGEDGEDLLALVRGVRKTIEEQLLVVEEMRVSLRQLLDSVNLIRTTIQG